MARLAVSLAGAAVGYATGIPGGASFGWLAGTIAGSLLFPVKQPAQEGPRLGDLQVTASSYGQPIPLGYGTVRLGGNIIWAPPIEERRTKSKSSAGGKGGGSSVTTTNYSYFASFAIAFAEGEADAVTRIWADGKLIYDVTTATNVTQKKGLKFRFYKGDETQLPDSLIEADKGVGNVPAHRGLVYMVFESLPLADYGNRIPNITAEISFTAQNAYPSTEYSFINSESFSAPRGAYDSSRKRIFVQTTTALTRFRAPSMQEDSIKVLFDDVIADFPTDGELTNFKLLTCDPTTGYIFAAYDESWLLGPGYDPHIFKIDPISLLAVQVFPTSFGSGALGSPRPLINSDLIFAAVDYATPITVSNDTSVNSFLATVSVSSSGVSFGLLNILDMTYVWHHNGEGDVAGTPISVPPIPGRNEPGEAEIFFVVHPDSTSSSPQIDFFRLQVTVAGGTVLGSTLTLTAAALGGTTFHNASTSGFVYDPDTNALIGVVAPDNVAGVVSIDCSDGTVNWFTSTGNAYTSTNRIDPRCDMSRSQVYIFFDGLLKIDKYTGEILKTMTYGWDTSGTTLAIDFSFNAAIDVPSPGAGIEYLDRIESGNVTLDQVVADLCTRAGLSEDEIDVSELSGISVKGYTVGRQSTIREAIEPLSAAFFFDGVESDGKIKFLTRGRETSVSLTQDDLGAPGEDAEYWVHTRGQEQELPMRVNVAYVDIDRDYQQGTQYDKRAAEPTPVMYSKNEVSVPLPIVLNGHEAKQIAEKILYAAWTERDSYSTVLNWTHLNLDPADVIEVTLDNGAFYKARITKIDLGADLSLNISAVAEETAAYVSAAVAENNYVPAEIHSGDNTSVIKIHNVPLLSDLHDQLRVKSVVYYQAGPLFAEGGWTGCNVYTSTDTITWTFASRIPHPMTYGQVSGTLAAPDDVFSIDRVSTLTIWPITGGDELDSITEDELLAGAMNMMIIGNEVVNFQNVTDNGNGSYTLDTFLRGRRGTDVYAGSHEALEKFYLIDDSTAETIFIALGQIGVPLYFKAVGDGLTLEEVPAVSFIPAGADLMPYAPVNATRSDDDPTAGDITIAWNRRTRINGDLVEDTGEVPLNEDTEEYEIDILDAPAGSVLRTLTATAETVVYEAADVVTDFGSPPATLYCRIYQMSAQVGRGFSYEFALEM
jgi:hypothetical protein